MFNKIKINSAVFKVFKIKVILFIIILLFLDLASKLIADNALQTQSIAIIPNFFSFSLAYNTGVSFSMFNALSYGQVLLSSLALTVGFILLFLIINSLKKVEIIGYSLICAGALGNGVDRLMHGHVIDFLDFYYKNWHYPTFNLADSFIFIGVFILLFENFFIKNTKK